MSQDDKVMTTKKKKIAGTKLLQGSEPPHLYPTYPRPHFHMWKRREASEFQRSTESVDVTERGSHQGVIILQDRNHAAYSM